jgi:hypothetical protein
VVQLLAAPTLSLGPNKLRMQLKTEAFYLGVNQPVRDCDHSTEYSAEAKTRWNCISALPMPL